MDLREGLGYARLVPNERQAYKILLSAFSSMAVSIDISQIHPSVDLMKIISAVLGDNPTVIYFNKMLIQIFKSAFSRRIKLTGVISKSQANKKSLELKKKAEQIILSIKHSSTDDYFLLLKIYEFLQSNIRYDQQELNALSRGKTNDQFSHNAYGALLNGTAVCDGFSSAFTLLANELCFESMLVNGDSLHNTAAAVKHSWNIVKVNGKHYHMDVTWDANQYQEINDFSYNYFAADDNDITNDHDWDINSTPSCSHNDLSYFTKNGLFANNMSQYEDIISFLLKKGNTAIRIKLSDTIPLPKDSKEHLFEIFSTILSNCGISKSYKYYWNEYARCAYVKLT